MNHGDEPGSSVSVQSCAGSRSWSRAPSSLLGCKYPEEKILCGCIVPPKVVRKSVGRGTRGHGTNNERRKLAITLGWCVEAVPDGGVGGSGWCFGQFLWVSRVSLCPCSECAGIPTDPELPKLPTQQEPGVGGHSEVFSAGPSPHYPQQRQLKVQRWQGMVLAPGTSQIWGPSFHGS